MATLLFRRRLATISGGLQLFRVFQFRSAIMSRRDGGTCSSSVKSSPTHVVPRGALETTHLR